MKHISRILIILIASSLMNAGVASASASTWYAPLLKLPKADLHRAECVMYRESRSTLAHPNLGDDNGSPGDSGIFQIDNTTHGVWNTYVLPKLHVQVWRASAYQQAEGFMLIWRVDRFGPWYKFDGC